MSDAIKHECGIAMVRLLKPLEYYRKKYGDVFWGMNKLYLLMEKQHNRGQDGAGMANIKFDIPPGNKYISIQKSNSTTPIKDIFHTVSAEIARTAEQPTPLIPNGSRLTLASPENSSSDISAMEPMEETVSKRATPSSAKATG